MMDLFDQVIAQTLGVPVQEYIDKIESLDQDQIDSIVLRLLSEDDTQVKEGIRMFNDI